MNSRLLLEKTAVAFAFCSIAQASDPVGAPSGAIVGAVAERPSTIEVEQVDVSINCTPKKGSAANPVCTFESTYRLFNPGEIEENLLGAFYTLAGLEKAFGISLELDGRNVRTSASQEELSRMEAVVRSSSDVAPQAKLFAAPFKISLAANRRAQLVFKGKLNEAQPGREGYEIPAFAARHPIFASHDEAWISNVQDFRYLLTPISTWRGEPKVHVKIRHLEASEFSASSVQFERTRERDGVVEQTVFRGANIRDIAFNLSYHHPTVHFGAPVVGIGPRLGREELVVRLGYEIGLGERWLVGAVAESNFNEYFRSALTVDVVAVPNCLVVPAVSVGAGPVVSVRDCASCSGSVRGGARAQVTLSGLFLSLSLPFDFYPEPDFSGTRVEAALMTSVSF